MSSHVQGRSALTSEKSGAKNEMNSAKRRPTTPAEEQALKLERLLANPEKAVVIPPLGRTEKTLRAPRETMKNVSGSSAGAGSGEFHIYKHSRRREGERVKLMEDADVKEKEAKDFAERQRVLAEEAAAKTDKNRSKRDKKRMARFAAKEAEKLSRSTSAKQEDSETQKSETLPMKRCANSDEASATSKRLKQNDSIVIEEDVGV